MSIESLRAARESSDAALQFQQGQGQNAKSVNSELGQKANQAAASKDAKARQLVQARYDLRVASADEELAKNEAERKQSGLTFAAVNVFSTMGLSLLDRYINNSSSELGNTEKPDEKAWKAREASKYVAAEKAKGREVVGGAGGVKFEEIEGQPGKLKATYEARDLPKDKTKTGEFDPASLGLAPGVNPEKATQEALGKKFGVSPDDVKLEPAEGGKFKYTITPPAPVGKADPAAKPEKTEKVSLTVDKVDIKADPGKSGAWHATNKWVLTPIFGTLADSYDSLKVFMQAKEKADQAVDKHKNAVQKRDAAQKKLQELEATLESF